MHQYNWTPTLIVIAQVNSIIFSHLTVLCTTASKGRSTPLNTELKLMLSSSVFDWLHRLVTTFISNKRRTETRRNSQSVYSPLYCGGRFSTNAFMPSVRSLVEIICSQNKYETALKISKIPSAVIKRSLVLILRLNVLWMHLWWWDVSMAFYKVISYSQLSHRPMWHSTKHKILLTTD